MLTPQTYSDPSQMYNLPPINPGAFGALPQEGPPQEGDQPQAGGPPPPGGEAPMDMNKYLIDKVMEIKRRMGSRDSGALGAITEAMMPQPQPQQPQPQQPPMRA